MDEVCNRNSEDDMTMQLSEKDSTFRFQKEIVYNKLLPYVGELDDEARLFLAEIKSCLGQAVMLRELEPGCSLWASRLYRYVRIYGYKFTKEDHILFIKLMYELILIPNLAPGLIKRFGYVLILLLRKKKLINPNELELPWRPLYELITTIKTRNSHICGMYRYSASIESILCSVAHAAKVYFPLSATQEILDELTPKICPLDAATMTKTVEALEMFLQLHISPEHHALGYQLWFNDFMNLWETCCNAQQWENSMLCLMAKLADSNIGYIDWEPYLPLMFTRFVRSLNLPVSYKLFSGSKPHKMDISPIAMWIVAALGNGSSCQTYLNKFFKTIETYLHPANSGRWTSKLRELLTKLPYYFTLRLEKERYRKPTWETPVPEKYKLTDDDIDAFVKSMLPVAMTAMFSKSGVEDASRALQHFAIIRPNLVIPDVLDQMYSTLDSLTEPHKLTNAMICMLAIALPVVQGSRNIQKGYTYPEGPTHVLPLLFSMLPGIDPNDTRKCFITLRVITFYATFIPIVDSSRSTVEMDEEERMICEATSRFEDFILQFLDRVFQLIDSSSLEFVRLENRVGDGKSELESIAEAELGGACTPLLMQTSDKIFESALHKLRTFITERILETEVAGQLAAILCQIFATVNGRATLRALVPLLSQTILDIIGEGDDVIKEENLDKHLLYAMLLLSSVVDTQGEHLLPYMSTLQNVLDRVLLLKSREGNNIACHMLTILLLSLSTVAPYKFRHADRDYNDTQYPFVRDWGKPVGIDSMQIQWYVPGDKEYAALVSLFSRYLLPQIEKLTGYCEDWNSMTRDELLSTLNIVRSVIRGCDCMLPIWDEPALFGLESHVKATSFTPTIGIKHKIVMPDGTNVRRYMVKLMSNVQRTILKYSEDDTKSLFTLIKIWTNLLLGKGRQLEKFTSKWNWFQELKKTLRHRLIKSKARMGPILLYHRVSMQHDARLTFQTPMFTETHCAILSELFTLGTSRYSDIRINAQSKLAEGLLHFPYAYRFLIPRLIDILKKDTEEHHDAYKGVLYILLGPQQEPILTRRDWHVIRSLWPAIILSKPCEKLSVLHLKEGIVNTIHKHFLVTPISIEIPEKCLNIASLLWNTAPQPTDPIPDVNKIDESLKRRNMLNDANVEAYLGLLGDLSKAILEKNLHWRHRLMAMSFIHDLVHAEQPYTPNILRYFLQALVHDSLMERKVAIYVVIFVLQQQKRKHPKITVDTSTFNKFGLNNRQTYNVGPGKQLDNSWLQYNYETRPLTAEQWDEPRYVHQTYTGYYTWPKELQIYAPSTQQPTLDPKVRELTVYEKEVESFFSDTQNLDKLIRYFSLEEKKGKDKFNVHRWNLFKCLFRNHGIVFLKNFIPHLGKLVQDKQESSQRCAAEIITGIIRGAKHWPFDMTCEMWKELLPIIRTALSNLTVETVTDWAMCFAIAQKRRDPNRHHWLLECLMEEVSLDKSEASFVECGRLHALEGVLDRQSWRVSQLRERLLVRLEDKLLTNPFQNVRERLGAMLSTIFDVDLKFPKVRAGQFSPKSQYLIDKVLPRLRKLAEDSTMFSAKYEQSLSAHMDSIKFDDTDTSSKLNEEERLASIRLYKTICIWVAGTSYYSQYGAQPGFYEFFPIICQLENCEADQELTKTCSSTLAVLAQVLILPSDMPFVLDAITRTSKHTSWWTRATCLEFLQVFIFHNMSTLLSNKSWVDCVRTIVLSLMEDVRLEVRETASQVLGGLLHCRFLTDHDDLLEYFKVKTRTKLRKRNHMSQDTEDAERNAQVDAIRTCHAGVLGLCAFILAHPYDIPNFVPLVFEHLGGHLNDPQPIPATIRKTVDNFKRTHYDRWTGINGYAQQFTPKQLSVLQDLAVQPSHYT